MKVKKFYLPYNFIQVTGKINNQKFRKKYDYDSGGAGLPDSVSNSFTGSSTVARHDVWLKDCYSGRIECSLTICTPTVVGNEQIPKDPTTIMQYTWRNQTALPANSLRGMISTVAETLSQSTLRVLDKRYWTAFQNINQDLVPWNRDRVKEGGLTPAELIFGVVENNKPLDDSKTVKDKQEYTRNLASRVRFSDGLLKEKSGDLLQKEKVILQELSSPKPEGYSGSGFLLDRPSLYFSERNKQPRINYDELTKWLNNPDSREPYPVPNGRKFYLLRENNRVGLNDVIQKFKKDEEELDPKNKSKCRPITKGTQFGFHIDFENLTQAELTLLKKALIPNEDFFHRLGLGKSLGMGIVKINCGTISFIDRKTIYSEEALNEESGILKEEKDLVKEDCSLIDKDTLKRMIKAGSLEALEKGVPVHWRQGFRSDQKATVPMPSLDSGRNFLPVFYQNIPLAGTNNNINVTPGAAGKQKTRVNQIAVRSTQFEKLHDWVKKEISKMRNGLPFEQLTEDQIKENLSKPGLFKRWVKIEDDVLKAMVRESIFAAAEDWQLTKGSRMTKKKYDNWSPR